MQLVVLLSLVLAFSSLLNADGQPVVGSDLKVAWSGLACAAVVALAWWIGQLKRHHTETSARYRSWIRLTERIHAGAYLGVMFIVFVAFDFAEIVHTNWQLRCYWLADDLVVSCALVVPLLGSWLFFSDALVGAGGADAFGQRLSYIWLQFRHLILLPLIPIFLVTGLADVQRLLWPENAELTRGLIGLSVVVAIAVNLPWWLRRCWPTRPLGASPVRATIEDTLAEAGVRVTEILHWDTQGQLANAAITGLVPRLRYLFVTDELIRRLSLADLRAITAHEAAHCRYRHLPKLMVSLAIPFVALMLIDEVAANIGWLDPSWRPVWMIAVLAAWSVGHGRWARLLEHQADLAACRWLSPGGRGIERGAVESFAHALSATAGTRGDWLHPSPNARRAVLELAAERPESELRLHHRVDALCRVQMLTVALLLMAWLGGV